jgi:hypothetical protein
MLDNSRLAKQVSDDERKKRRASEMNDVRHSDFTNEIHQPGVAKNTIWQLRIIHIPTGSLREQSNFDRLFAVFA